MTELSPPKSLRYLKGMARVSTALLFLHWCMSDDSFLATQHPRFYTSPLGIWVQHSPQESLKEGRANQQEVEHARLHLEFPNIITITPHLV